MKLITGDSTMTLDRARRMRHLAICRRNQIRKTISDATAPLPRDTFAKLLEIEKVIIQWDAIMERLKCSH